MSKYILELITFFLLFLSANLMLVGCAMVLRQLVTLCIGG